LGVVVRRRAECGPPSDSPSYDCESMSMHACGLKGVWLPGTVANKCASLENLELVTEAVTEAMEWQLSWR